MPDGALKALPVKENPPPVDGWLGPVEFVVFIVANGFPPEGGPPVVEKLKDEEPVPAPKENGEDPFWVGGGGFDPAPGKL